MTFRHVSLLVFLFVATFAHAGPCPGQMERLVPGTEISTWGPKPQVTHVEYLSGGKQGGARRLDGSSFFRWLTGKGGHNGGAYPVRLRLDGNREVEAVEKVMTPVTQDPDREFRDLIRIHEAASRKGLAAPFYGYRVREREAGKKELLLYTYRAGTAADVVRFDNGKPFVLTLDKLYTGDVYAVRGVARRPMDFLTPEARKEISRQQKLLVDYHPDFVAYVPDADGKRQRVANEGNVLVEFYWDARGKMQARLLGIDWDNPPNRKDPSGKMNLERQARDIEQHLLDAPPDWERAPASAPSNQRASRR